MLRSASPLASSLLRAARPLAVLPTQPIIHPSASASYPRAAAMLSSSTSDHAQRATATAALAGADNKAPAGSPGPSLRSLEDLTFDNTFTAELPGEAEENRVRQVHGAFYSYVTPTPTGTEPTTIIASREVADLIGLDPSELDRPEFALIFSGNAPLPSAKPYAQCYGGHQFGSWAGQLGDGRAICLGEVLNQQTGLRWELQMKGAGRTPYSRMADGRAVLRSSLREYVASEAMAALGVPTTRALSLVATGDQVRSQQGGAQLLLGAMKYVHTSFLQSFFA